MSDEIKYTLNVQSVDNPLTKEEGDKRFILVSNGTADFDRVISEIMAVNPGLERETVEAVIKLEHRIIQRLTLSGMRVSNGLFSAVASPLMRQNVSRHNAYFPPVKYLSAIFTPPTNDTFLSMTASLRWLRWFRWVMPYAEKNGLNLDTRTPESAMRLKNFFPVPDEPKAS